MRFGTRFGDRDPRSTRTHPRGGTRRTGAREWAEQVDGKQSMSADTRAKQSSCRVRAPGSVGSPVPDRSGTAGRVYMTDSSPGGTVG